MTRFIYAVVALAVVVGAWTYTHTALSIEPNQCIGPDEIIPAQVQATITTESAVGAPVPCVLRSEEAARQATVWLLSIVGVLLALVGVLFPLYTYFQVIRPVGDIEARFREFQSNFRREEVERLVGAICGSSSTLHQSALISQLEQHTDLTDEHLGRVYQALPRAHDMNAAWYQLAVVLSRRRGAISELFFREELQAADHDRVRTLLHYILHYALVVDERERLVPELVRRIQGGRLRITDVTRSARNAGATGRLLRSRELLRHLDHVRLFELAHWLISDGTAVAGTPLGDLVEGVHRFVVRVNPDTGSEEPASEEEAGYVYGYSGGRRIEVISRGDDRWDEALREARSAAIDWELERRPSTT